MATIAALGAITLSVLAPSAAFAQDPYFQAAGAPATAGSPPAAASPTTAQAPAQAAAPGRPDGFTVSFANGIAALSLAGVVQLGNVGSRLGYRSGQWVPFLTVDYYKLALSAGDTSSAASIVTLGGGVKYLFKLPAANTVSPYIVGSVFKVLASSDVDESIDKYLADTSTLGFLAGLGAEYSFSPEFSIGAEGGPTYFSASQSSGDTTATVSILRLYSAVTMSFYF